MGVYLSLDAGVPFCVWEQFSTHQIPEDCGLRSVR